MRKVPLRSYLINRKMHTRTLSISIPDKIFQAMEEYLLDNNMIRSRYIIELILRDLEEHEIN